MRITRKTVALGTALLGVYPTGGGVLERDSAGTGGVRLGTWGCIMGTGDGARPPPHCTLPAEQRFHARSTVFSRFPLFRHRLAIPRGRTGLRDTELRRKHT